MSESKSLRHGGKRVENGKLDEAYIEDWLSQFSEALENPDILREYQKLQKKIRDLAGE
jgi:hypothetical protein